MKLILLFFLSFQVMASDPLDMWTSMDNDFSVYVMKCKDKVTLLDYYELYEVESRYKYDVPAIEIDKIIEVLLNRSKKLSLPRSILYRKWKKHFNGEAKFISNINFGPLNDEFDFTRRNGCEVKTLFKAVNPLKPGKGIFVEKLLWDRLDTFSKAGAIFNYLINLDYIFIEKNTNTVYSRFFNALLSSNRLQSVLPLSQKSHLFKTIGFNYLYDNNLFLSPGSLQVSNKSQIIYGKILMIPFELHGLGFKNEMEIHNIKGMRIGNLYGEAIDTRRDSMFIIDKAKVISECVGKYKFPSVPIRLRLVMVNGKIHLKDMFSYHLLYKGEGLEKIQALNGEILLTPNEDGRIYSNRAEEITLCNK